MKTSVIIAMFLSMSLMASGQLTGTLDIPSTPYPTIQSAIAALNTQGVGTDGVIFNVAAGHTETFSSPTAGLITATGTATNTIIFQKSGTGANPVITAGTGTSTSTDGIIKLAGTDYITFNGINLQENSGNTTNTKRMEWGYALVKKQGTSPFDGCQYVVIKNCTITLTENSGSNGIYTGNHIATSTSNLTITSTGDAHNYCKFFNNTIVNCMEPISLNGFNASAPYTLYDQNNEVGVDGGNTITGVGGAQGIFAIYQNNLKIANNIITEPGGADSDLSGIFASSSTAATISIYGNTISLTGSGGGGSKLYGIKCNSGSNTAGSVTRIYDNIVQNCGFSTSSSSLFNGISIGADPYQAYIYNNSVINNTVTGAGTFSGINISAGAGPENLSIYSNTISGNQKTGASGILYGIVATQSNIDIHLNNIFNNTIPSSSGTSSPAQIIGYYDEFDSPVENIYLNNIYNLTISGSNTHDLTAIYGMFTNSYGSKNIYSNNIHGFSSHKGVVTGISSPHGNAVSIFKNNIYNLYSNAGESNETCVKGIDLNETTDAYIYNNFISDLRTTSASSSNAIAGIFQEDSQNSHQKLYLYYNTVYLDASSTGSTFGTSAFYCGNTVDGYNSIVLMKNNIFVNLSTPNGTGLTVAHRRNGTLILGYSYESSNNDFYAGTPGPSHLLFYDGTYPQETLADYQTWVSPRESKSFSENPPFIDITGPPYNLHLSSPDPNFFESGGIIIATPLSITDDFDNNPRYPNPGYPDIAAHPAKAPDVGADEFAGIHLDLVSPVIAYTPLDKTPSLVERTLIATITDDYAGVPIAGIGLPQLYWRITHGGTPGSWQNAQGVSIGSDQYTFTFGAGVFPLDVVDYYIVAQDLAPIPNVSTSAFYGGAFTYDPPACIDVPDVFDNYFIMGSLCGSYNVGVGQPFETITDAMSALENNVGTCPITFLLTDADYLNEMYLPFALTSYPWSDATRTITIKPAPGVTPCLTAYTGYAIFWLHGASYVTIDGSNTEGGTDRSLTIENLYGGDGASAVRLSIDGINGVQHCVIKNCILKGGNRINDWDGMNYGIYAGDGGNNDITIQNNEFQIATTGLYLGGNGSNVSTGGIITKNVFGNPDDDYTLGYAGMEIRYADGFMINDNTFQNILSENDNVFGMIIGENTINTTITKNLITGVKYNGIEGFGGKGMEINTGQSASNIVIANNVISDISGDGYFWLDGDAIVGIRILGSTGGVDLFYNSVHLFGNVSGYDSEDRSAAIYFGGSVTNIKLKDNVFSNSIFDIDYDAYAYSIYSEAENTAFTVIDYNDYHVSGAQGILGYLYYGDINSLTEWQEASAQDAYSLNEDPLFISDTDLHPDPGSSLVAAGTPIPDVVVDFEGNTRDLSTPTIGAYEIAPEPDKTWDGSESNYWNTAENWTPEGVPAATDNLTIPAGVPHCILDATGLFCKHITIETGATVIMTVDASITVMGNLTLEDGGAFTNNGLLILKGNLINLAAGK